jgi:Spy/CpxP family protein refolding chaperone
MRETSTQLGRAAASALAAVLALALLPLPADAQRGRGALRRQAQAAQMEAGDVDAGRPGALNRQAILVRALKSLALRPEQRRLIEGIRDRNDGRMREFGRRLLDGRRQIDEMLSGPAPNVERARLVARETSRVSGERTVARTMLETEVFEVLDPQQRAELRQKREAFRDQLVRQARERRRAARVDRQQAASEPDAAEDLDGEEEPQAPPVPANGGGRMAPLRPNGQNFAALVDALGLTPDQRTRIFELRRAHAPALRELNRTYRETQRRIDDALLADRVDADALRRLAGELGRLESDRDLERFETEVGLRAILTPEQAARLGELRRRP